MRFPWQTGFPERSTGQTQNSLNLTVNRSLSDEQNDTSHHPLLFYSFSDHEAVTATIQVRRDEEASRARIPDVKRALSQMRRPECVQVVREAIDIIKRSQNYILKDKFAYGSLAG